MKFREAISRIKKLFKLVNADSRFTNKLAYSILRTAAKVLIKREADKYKIFSQSHLFQSYKCIELIEAPAIDSCCGIRTSCTVWRTKDKIPTVYEDLDGPIIKSIYTLDRSEIFTQINPTDYLNIKNNPWNKKDKTKYYFYSDGYIYFPNGGYKMIDINAYWEEEIVSKCENTVTDCVRFLDQNFRIPGYLEKPMFEFAEQEIASIYMKLPETGHQIDKNSNTSNIQS